MRRILAFAAAAEALTGLSLLVIPSTVGRLLLGAEFVGSGVAAARVAGIALIALGVACWPERRSRAGEIGLLLYTTLVAIFFVVIGMRGETVGVLLWPVAVYHALLGLALGKGALRARRTPDSPEPSQ